MPRGPDGTPVRPLSLQDLPPAIAAKLQFDAAAPKRLRTADLPAPVAEELRQLWDGIVADVYDQVAGVSRRKALGRDQVQQVLQRVASRVVHAERVLIVAAVHAPVPASAEWKHVAMAGAGGAGAAFAEELAVLGSAGTAVTVAIVAAVAGEVLETYVAASARTVQYERAHRSPDAAIVVTDLAEAGGFGNSANRRANVRVVREAADWLGQQLIERTARRFARSLVPVVGVAIGGGTSAAGVRKVTKLPLRPPAKEELVRLAEDLLTDPAATEEVWPSGRALDAGDGR